MKRHSLNTSRILGKKARLVEWKPRKGSRAHRFVAVEVGASSQASTSQPISRQDTGGIKNDGAIQRAASMDFANDTLWIDEPVMPKKKRVSLPTCPSSTVFYISLSPSAPTWMTSFLRSTLTWIAFSILRAFQLQHAKAACLHHLSGGALTVFLLLHSAKNAAGSHTSSSPSTGFRGGRESSLCHRGCGRLA
jgi:hypothetical protein